MSPSSDPPQGSEATVRLPADLHARPAGQLARAAAGFAATVTVRVGGREVDARSVLLVMSLGATAGTEVTVRASGAEAEAAVRALAAILASGTPIERSPSPAQDPATSPA